MAPSTYDKNLIGFQYITCNEIVCASSTFTTVMGCIKKAIFLYYANLNLKSMLLLNVYNVYWHSKKFITECFKTLNCMVMNEHKEDPHKKFIKKMQFTNIFYISDVLRHNNKLVNVYKTFNLLLHLFINFLYSNYFLQESRQI